jgi:NADH-quinone oxidoreductase subunit M
VQHAFHGPNDHYWKIPDLIPRELVALVPMIALLVWLGLYPQPVFNVFRPALTHLQQVVSQTNVVGRR